MMFSLLELTIFIGFIVLFLGVALTSRRQKASSQGYFLADRKLPWWLIGVSLVATNTSTNTFVGHSGSGFGRMGLAVANYDLIGCAAMVFVAWYLLPQFLHYRIFTIPQFLEYRYSASARLTMAIGLLVSYLLIGIASVLYSGAIGLEAILGVEYTTGVWIVGIITAAYTAYGGLKAVVWSDLFQGTVILLGVALIVFLGLNEAGGMSLFLTKASEKLHLILPRDHPDLPWTAMLAGIWIPNIYYWGLNQSIMQRALAAKSIRDGQLGVLFGAVLKAFRPFFVVLPGILAFILYSDQIDDPEHSFFVLVQKTLPGWTEILMLTVLPCAILSTLDSRLSSAATVFTVDLYKRYVRREASQTDMVYAGRLATVAFALLGCIVAHNLRSPDFKGIFDYAQRLQGFLSPGVVTVFLFGLLVRRASPTAAVCTMLANVPLYGFLLMRYPEVAFLNHMAITVTVLTFLMASLTILAPSPISSGQPSFEKFEFQSSNSVRIIGVLILLLLAIIYWQFW